MINVSKMTCTDTVQSGTGEENGEEMAFDGRPEDTHRRCRSEVVKQTVPYTSSGNRKGSVANGRQITGSSH